MTKKKSNLHLLQLAWFGFLITAFFFLATTFFILTRFAQPLDLSFTTLIQAKIAARYDPVLSFLSLICNFEVLLFLATLILLGAKKFRAWLTVISIFLGGHLIELLGKTFLLHPKPPLELDRTRLNLHLPTHFISTISSYPSGHSFRCVYFAVLLSWWLCQQKNGWLKWMGLLGVSVWVIITLVSRISLGQHWLSDVVGGTWLGAALAFLTIILLDQLAITTFWHRVMKQLPFRD